MLIRERRDVFKTKVKRLNNIPYRDGAAYSNHYRSSRQDSPESERIEAARIYRRFDLEKIAASGFVKKPDAH
jgi:hypothetical protein